MSIILVSPTPRPKLRVSGTAVMVCWWHSAEAPLMLHYPRQTSIPRRAPRLAPHPGTRETPTQKLRQVRAGRARQKPGEGRCPQRSKPYKLPKLQITHRKRTPLQSPEALRSLATHSLLIPCVGERGPSTLIHR
jgi:hypothetical protein